MNLSKYTEASEFYSLIIERLNGYKEGEEEMEYPRGSITPKALILIDSNFCAWKNECPWKKGESLNDWICRLYILGIIESSQEELQKIQNFFFFA